jgi:serine/threonine-protein kinase RsbW
MSTDPRTAQRRLHLVLASEHVSLAKVVDETQAFVSSCTDDDDLIFRVVLLTSEAFTNAIEHGNELDPNREVVLDVELYARSIEVSVQDEGKGFDRSVVDNPLAEENLLNEGGRGLYFIERMADEVHYEEGGRRIRMVFHRPTG